MHTSLHPMTDTRQPVHVAPPCDAASIVRAKAARDAERAEAQVTNGLIVLVEWFGAEGVQNLLDHINAHGTADLRRRLAHILSVKGGR